MGRLRSLPRATQVFLSWVCVLGLGVSVSSGFGRPADDEVFPIVVELLRSSDRDMRGLGLQQVRQALPGAEVTRRLGELLPTLGPEGQAALLEALAERADPVARAAILQAGGSSEELVRAAALRALGRVGQPEDVRLLAEKAAAGGALEKEAARQSLVALRGPEISAAMLALVPDSGAEVRIELLRVLGVRRVAEAMPAVLGSAGDTNRSVRLAAWTAARSLARPEDLTPLIRLAGTVSEDVERQAAQESILALCGRMQAASVETLLTNLPRANVSTRIILLRALGTTGRPRALEGVVTCLKDSDPSVRKEALRILSGWADRAAAPHLLGVARGSAQATDQALAVRGLVRLASAENERPADLELLRQAWLVSGRLEERRLVLGALGALASAESMRFAMRGLDDPDTASEASLAVILIAEKLSDAQRGEVQEELRRVVESTTDTALRERARRLLGR